MIFLLISLHLIELNGFFFCFNGGERVGGINSRFLHTVISCPWSRFRVTLKVVVEFSSASIWRIICIRTPIALNLLAFSAQCHLASCKYIKSYLNEKHLIILQTGGAKCCNYHIQVPPRLFLILFTYCTLMANALSRTSEGMAGVEAKVAKGTITAPGFWLLNALTINAVFFPMFWR